MFRSKNSVTDYTVIINKITKDTGIVFRPASPESIVQLNGLGLPEPVVRFYRKFEPTSCGGQVRIWPVTQMLEENRTLAPGAYTAPHGYVVGSSAVKESMRNALSSEIVAQPAYARDSGTALHFHISLLRSQLTL